MKNKSDDIASSIFRHVLLCSISLTSVLPFYWMLNTALKGNTEVYRYPPSWFPETLRLDNFVTIFRNPLLLVYLRNSVFVSLIEALFTVLICLLAAFGFYRFRFRGKNALMLLCLVVNFIPFEVVMAYNYQTMIRAGLGDSLVVQILPFLTNYFYVIVFYNAFRSIPETIYISACADGASTLHFLFRIAWKMIRPTVVFVFLLSFISSWNAFVWPSLIINSPMKRTLPFGIYSYMSELESRTELVMAMSCIMELPALVIFLSLQKYLLNGFRKVA